MLYASEKMKTAVTILVLLMSHLSFCQERAANWYFGANGAGLDFNCSPPEAIRGGMYYVVEGTSSISDENGNLLFYTNGDTVYNRDHGVMPNGFGIGQNPECFGSSTQGALITPVPNNPDEYYIFTTDCADDGQLMNGLRYSIVDMTLENGFGDVTTKFELLHVPVTEKLAAIHHANDENIWVLAQEHGTNNFLAYLVDSNGLNTTPVISSVGQTHTLPTFPESMARGYMKFSPNGEKIIVVSVSDQHEYALYPELFSFNDQNGTVTLDYTVVDPDSINYYGASFSPDNNLLYLSGAWKGDYVHQFNANSETSQEFLNSKQVIFTSPDLGYRPGALQIGPDGKIYIATNQQWLDVIENPNMTGQDCGYLSQAIFTVNCPFTGSIYGLPNFPESYFRETFIGGLCSDTIYAEFFYEGDCFDSPSSFISTSFSFPESITNWQWDFDDPDSGISNQSFDQNPTHIFSNTGIYDVTLVVSVEQAELCKSDTIIIPVEIDICTNTIEKPVYPDIKIFPNPFNEILNFEFSDNQDLSYVEILSLDGRILVKEEISSNQEQIQLNIDDSLPSGVYIARITGEKMNLKKRIVRIK
jgi:hypothetical protein